MTKANIYSAFSLHMYARNSQKDLFNESMIFNFQAKNVVCKLIIKNCFAWQKIPRKGNGKYETKFTRNNF